MGVSATDAMRQDWDERARKDAFHYIASWRKDWSPEAFFQSGEEDYQRLVAPFLSQLRWEPRGKSVLQHLPTPSLVLHYVSELLRVLRGGGLFLFQFNSNRKTTMNWKGRSAWSLVDALWNLRLNRLSRATATVLGFDPYIVGKSWRG